MSEAWYLDDESPEQIAADLAQMRQQRQAMTEEQRLELASFLLEDMEPKGKQPAPKPATPAPATPAQAPAATAASIASDVREGRRPHDHVEAGREFAALKLREAAGS